MKKQYPILGRVMTVLGVVGTLLCLIMFISIWIVGGRVIYVSSNAVGQVESKLNKLVTVAVDAQTGIDATKKVARKLETRIREQAKTSLQKAVKPSPESMVKIDELEEKLNAGVVKVRQLADSADAVLIFAEEMMTILQSTGIFFKRNPESFDQIVTALRSGRTEIANLEEQVLQLKGRVADVRAGVKSTKKNLETKMLSDKIDTSLINLNKYANIFEQATTKVLDATKQIQLKIRNMVLMIQLIVTILLVWQAGAQVSLAILGSGISRKDGLTVE